MMRGRREQGERGSRCVVTLEHDDDGIGVPLPLRKVLDLIRIALPDQRRPAKCARGLDLGSVPHELL